MKRYEKVGLAAGYSEMRESPDGEWVKAEDALALQETLMLLLEEHGLAHNKIMGFLRQMENAE